MKSKRLFVLLTILFLLIAARTLRWKSEVDKTLPKGVLEWRTDRWTGQVWLIEYGTKGTAEWPVGDKFVEPDAPLFPGIGISNGEEDPWGRQGLRALLFPPTNEQLREYIERSANIEKNTKTYQEAVAYLAAVTEWEKAVQQAELNIMAAWALRNRLTLAWSILSFAVSVWIAIELLLVLINKRTTRKLS